MIDNDYRKEHMGFRLGQFVRFRWNMKGGYEGVITRLCRSRACIRFVLNNEEVVKYVSYNQIEEE